MDLDRKLKLWSLTYRYFRFSEFAGSEDIIGKMSESCRNHQLLGAKSLTHSLKKLRVPIFNKNNTPMF